MTSHTDTRPDTWRDLAERTASLLHIQHKVRRMHDDLGAGYGCSGCALLAEWEIALHGSSEPDSVSVG